MLDGTSTLEEELKKISLTKYSLCRMVSALEFNTIHSIPREGGNRYVF